MDVVLTINANVMMDGMVNYATPNFVILAVTNMVSVRTELACASPAGMENIVHLKVVLAGKF